MIGRMRWKKNPWRLLLQNVRRRVGAGRGAVVESAPVVLDGNDQVRALFPHLR